MSDFKPGDRVRVVIESARVFETRVEGHDDDTTSVVRLLIERADGQQFGVTLPTKWVELVTIERSAPAEWPPQAGDLWRDHDGSVWLACAVGDSEISIITMICEAGAADRSHEQVLTRFGPLTLVHREEANGS